MTTTIDDDVTAETPQKRTSRQRRAASIADAASGGMKMLLLKLVVEEYIRHIAPHDPPLVVVPGMAATKPWNRASWIAVEFNLLYRWHMLVPDTVTTDEGTFPSREFLRDNNALVVDKGIEWVFAQASRSRADRVGLFNTPAFLTERESPDVPAVEERSIALMRFARLASYNDYRAHCRFPCVTDFDQISSDPRVRDGLRACYGSVDRVEFYVGLFAEDTRPNSVLPSLIGPS